MTTTAKTTKAPKAKKLLLTSRAKMGRAKAPKKARAEQITQELVDAGTNPQAAEVIGEIMAQVPAPLDLDGTAEAPTMADVIGAGAEAQAKTAETDPTVETLVALITRAEGATVDQMMEATGLTRGGLRTTMNKTVVGKLGYRTTLERIPNSTPARFVYRASR